MGRLPNADRAIVPEAKIRRYLLDLTSEHGQSKARFFLAFGFTMEAWGDLAEALRAHAVRQEVAGERQTPFGTHYNVEGPVQTPDGRDPHIRSVWKIERGTTVPVLVTAYPPGKRTT